MAAETAFFISERYLKDNYPLSENIDMKEVYPFAKSAEDVYIQEAIGTQLFDRLVESLTASPKNTTANETILLKKIRSCLGWYTCYDALPFLAIKIRNIGIVKQTGDNLASAERDDITYLRKACKDKADHYMTMLQKYLCENSDLFEEYCCANWNCSQLMPNTSVSNSSDLAIDKGDRDIQTEFVRKWLNNG
jgi:hypothetical protein